MFFRKSKKSKKTSSEFAANPAVVFVHPVFEPSAETELLRTQARIRAAMLRDESWDGYTPVTCLTASINQLNVKRYFSKLHPMLSGLVIRYFKEGSDLHPGIMCINSQQSIQNQRFVSAHMFGHIIERGVHQRETPWSFQKCCGPHQKMTPNEFFADQFAMEFLMPSELVLPIIENNSDDTGKSLAMRIAKEFNVTVDVVARWITALRKNPV